MESNEKLDLSTDKVEPKEKWQIFDILNVKRPTIAKLKESLTLAKTTCTNLEARYIDEQLANNTLLERIAKVNNDIMRKEHTIERLETTNKAHEETIDCLKKQLNNANNKVEQVKQLLDNTRNLNAAIISDLQSKFDDLQGKLAANKATKSYPLIVMLIIAVVEAIIIFCLV